jgi:hypothetical protein
MFIQVSEDEHIAIDTIASIYRYWDARSALNSLYYVVTTKRGSRYDVKNPVFVNGIKKLLNPEV